MEEDQAILQYPSQLLLFNEGDYQNKNFQGFSCSNNDFGEGDDIRNQTSPLLLNILLPFLSHFSSCLIKHKCLENYVTFRCIILFLRPSLFKA